MNKIFPKADDSANEKKVNEKRVAKLFAKVCPLKIKIDSIENRDPPEPDILCERENGQKVALELVEVIDEGLAKSVYTSSGKGGSYGHPIIKQICKKLSKSKNYDTKARMELLVYYDLQPQMPTNVLKPTLEEHSMMLKKKLRKSDFKKIWIFNDRTSEILYQIT